MLLRPPSRSLLHRTKRGPPCLLAGRRVKPGETIPEEEGDSLPDGRQAGQARKDSN